MNSASVLRKTLHQEAREHLDSGRYLEAETLLLDTIHQLGPHVGPLCDLVYLSYIQNRIDQFESYFAKLCLELSVAEDRLSPDSHYKTLLFLAKYFEEVGFVEKAIMACNKALELADTVARRKKIQIQKLRLLASLGPSDELSLTYAECNRTTGYEQDLQIELLHGLMLAEIGLVGFKAAHKRLFEALCKTQDKIDRGLILADFLEQEFLNDKPTQLDHSLIAELRNGDSFERCLYEFSKNNFNFFFEIEDSLTKMSWFRCAALFLKLSPVQNDDLLRKFQLLLNSVPASSHKLLSRKWPFIWKSQEEHVILLKTDRVLFKDRELLIGRKNNLKLTLLYFSQNQEGSLEDFVNSALQEKHDTYSFDQVRMIFARIQKDFSQHLGIIFPVFHVSKDRVWKNERLKITGS